MDIFEKYLTLRDSNDLIRRALTDNSYKHMYQKENHTLYEEKTNFELATYGDAVIKLAYCDILLDNMEHLTVEKSKWESDKFFVEVVAKKYDMLSYIIKDKDNKDIIESYNYEAYRKTNGDRLKYIATAVEAMVGAIFILNHKNINIIVSLLKTWMNITKEGKTMTFDEILESFRTNPRDVKTVPINRDGLWFYVYVEAGTLYCDNALSHKPSSKMKNRRRLEPNKLDKMIEFYHRRLNGEAVGAEVTAYTQNQVYWFGIIAELGL